MATENSLMEKTIKEDEALKIYPYNGTQEKEHLLCASIHFHFSTVNKNLFVEFEKTYGGIAMNVYNDKKRVCTIHPKFSYFSLRISYEHYCI